MPLHSIHHVVSGRILASIVVLAGLAVAAYYFAGQRQEPPVAKATIASPPPAPEPAKPQPSMPAATSSISVVEPPAPPKAPPLPPAATPRRLTLTDLTQPAAGTPLREVLTQLRAAADQGIAPAACHLG